MYLCQDFDKFVCRFKLGIAQLLQMCMQGTVGHEPGSCSFH
jgi:hypothetical protein